MIININDFTLSHTTSQDSHQSTQAGREPEGSTSKPQGAMNAGQKRGHSDIEGSTVTDRPKKRGRPPKNVDKPIRKKRMLNPKTVPCVAPNCAKKFSTPENMRQHAVIHKKDGVNVAELVDPTYKDKNRQIKFSEKYTGKRRR
jgi:hypothetical protein